MKARDLQIVVHYARRTDNAPSLNRTDVPVAQKICFSFKSIDWSNPVLDVDPVGLCLLP
jgi:hypothetical protein